MSRTARLVGGVSFGYFTQAVITIAGLWLTPFLLTHLGGYQYGLWLVTLQLQAYLTLVDFGVLALLSRDMGHAMGRARSVAAPELPAIIGRAARLVLWQLPPLALVAIVLWLLMSGEWGTLRWPLGVMLLTFVAMYPLRICNVILYGLQEHAFNAKAHFSSWSIGFVLTIALVTAGWGLYAVAAGWAATQLLTAIAAAWRLQTKFRVVLPRHLPDVPWRAGVRELKRGVWLSVNQIAQLLLAGTDLVIVAKLLGPSAVVPYALTGKLPAVLANQPMALGVAAGPALAEITTAESAERMAQVSTALGQAILVLSGAIVCIVMVCNEGFVRWWVGDAQYGGLWLTAALLATMFLRHWNVGLSCVLFALGYEKRLCQTYLVDGVVTVVAGIALTKTLGPIGAPLGSVVGVLFVTLPLNISLLLKENRATRSVLTEAYRPWLWRLPVLIAAAVLVARVWVPGSFPELAATAAVAGGVYVLTMLPAILRDPLGMYVRPRLPAMSLRIFRALKLCDAA